MSTEYDTREIGNASPFEPLPGEANLGPPVGRELIGGAHIAPQCITVTREGKLAVAIWPTGLPRHEAPGTQSARFPHGLMLFGESIEESVNRLVRAQLGMTVLDFRVCHVFTELDDSNHWHLEPLVAVRVDGDPTPAGDSAVVFCDELRDLPGEFRLPGKPPIDEIYREWVAPVIHLLTA